MTPGRIAELREYAKEMGAHRPEMLRMRECLDEIERLRGHFEHVGAYFVQYGDWSSEVAGNALEAIARALAGDPAPPTVAEFEEWIGRKLT